MSFYIVPIIGTGAPHVDPRRPKYISDLGVSWQMVPLSTTAVVWADTTPAQEAAVALNLDATVVPPLTDKVAVATMTNALESFDIPAQWINASLSNRDVLRKVVGMAQIIQRTEGLGNRISLSGKLNTRLDTLAAGDLTTLNQACDSLSLDRSQITGSTTLREFMQIMGDQFIAGRAISLGDL